MWQGPRGDHHERQRVVEKLSRMGASDQRPDVLRTRSGRLGISDLERLRELRVDRGLSVSDRPTGSDIISNPADNEKRSATLPPWYHAIILGLSIGIIIMIFLVAMRWG